MSLYCLKCKKWANRSNHPCPINSLISVTKNMLPVALKVDGLGLQVASAFCLSETHREPYNHALVEAGVYFNRIYPEVLLQDLPSGWYWTDYITLEHKVICSCIVYESEYIDNDNQSLDEFVTRVINDLVGYLVTRQKDGLTAVMTLLES